MNPWRFSLANGSARPDMRLIEVSAFPPMWASTFLSNLQDVISKTPPIAPTPIPTATPKAKLGDSVNLLTLYKLNEAVEIGLTAPFRLKHKNARIQDVGRIKAITATLNTPIAVLELPTQSFDEDESDIGYIIFTYPYQTYLNQVTLGFQYNFKNKTLYMSSPDRLKVAVPPEFLQAVGWN